MAMAAFLIPPFHKFQLTSPFSDALAGGLDRDGMLGFAKAM
jgi:hypothetical protein